jgi:circadian clock protein KaiB
MDRREQGTNGLAPEGMVHAPFRLRLYISGNTVTSSRAIINLRQFCEKHLRERYELEVVDLSHDPGAAAREGILALPTLVKLAPGPVRRFIGDMSNTKRLENGLGLVHEGN